MYNPELQVYVANSRAAGIADEQIKATLLSHGWAETDINEALSGQAVPSPNGQSEVASRGTRLLNNILDSIVLYAIMFAVGFALAYFSVNQDQALLTDYAWLVGIIVCLGYYILFESVWQKTVGKMVTGTKVVMPDGSKPDFLHILGRTLGRMIPFDALSFLVKPRGWHDQVSGTLVVSKHYTPEEVSRIDLNQKSKTSVIGIILVVVVGVMIVGGILASVVLVSLNGARIKSRDAMRVADVRQIMTSLEIYSNDYGVYPVELSELVADNIMSHVPDAPIPADGSCTEIQNNYTYVSSGSTYTISFCLGGATGGYQSGVRQATPMGIN